MEEQEKSRVALSINGTLYESEIEPRQLLADFIRHEAGLKGTHVGCAHGVCGACTIQIDGCSARSCLHFAVDVQGSEITTVEGLTGEQALHPLQQAFMECHALQCGFCTPGFLMTAQEFLRECPSPTEEQVREALANNLCRCTGYVNIVKAVMLAAQRMRDGVAQEGA